MAIVLSLMAWLVDSTHAQDAAEAGTILNTLLYTVAAAVPLLVILFTWKLARGARRWRWRRKGRCLVCGYDLRGHIELGRGARATCCPECGRMQPAAA